MSITKSFNKKTNTIYAYETLYVWDEFKQKKVQKRKCIGKIDPLTGKVLPNAKRGRPALSVPVASENVLENANKKRKVKRLIGRIDRISYTLMSLQKELEAIKEELQEELH